MKNIKQKLIKLLVFFLFLILVASNTIVGYFYLSQRAELDRFTSLYSETQNLLNQNKEETQVTIENLQNSFRELNSQVSSLRSENENLNKQLQKFNNLGTISGRLVAFVSTSDTPSLSQFQLVCAQNVQNSNIKYCISASSLVGEYSLLVPSGKYYLTSTLILSDGKYANIVAKYTNYVKCIADNNGTKDCSAENNELVEVVVEPNAVVSKINPIDLR